MTSELIEQKKSISGQGTEITEEWVERFYNNEKSFDSLTNQEKVMYLNFLYRKGWDDAMQIPREEFNA